MFAQWRLLLFQNGISLHLIIWILCDVSVNIARDRPLHLTTWKSNIVWNWSLFVGIFGLEPFNFDEFDVCILYYYCWFTTTHAKPLHLLPFLIRFFQFYILIPLNWALWTDSFSISSPYIFYGIKNTVQFIFYFIITHSGTCILFAFMRPIILLVRCYLSRNWWFLNIWCIAFLSFLLPHSLSCYHSLSLALFSNRILCAIRILNKMVSHSHIFTWKCIILLHIAANIKLNQVSCVFLFLFHRFKVCGNSFTKKKCFIRTFSRWYFHCHSITSFRRILQFSVSKNCFPVFFFLPFFPFDVH